MEIEQQDFDISISVYQTNETTKVLGSFHPDMDNVGWILDRTNFSESNQEVFRNILDTDDEYKTLNAESSDRNHLYFPPIQGYSIDSIEYDLWQPGVGFEKDLLYRRIYTNQYLSNIYEGYFPVIYSGTYYVGPESHYLYSDASVVQYPNLDDDLTSDGVSYSKVRLSHTPDLSFPLSARIYKRNSYGSTQIWRDYKYTSAFIGTLSSGVRASTLDNGTILWSNVDNNHIYEFLLSQTYDLGDSVYDVVFNQSARHSLLLPDDFDSSDSDNLLDHYLDYLGVSLGEVCESYYSNYFPIFYIDSNDVKVWTYDPSDDSVNRISWTVVTDLESFYFAGENDRIVLLDKDLGRIQFNGYEPVDTILSQTLHTSDTEMYVLDAADFPPQGTIKLSVGSGGEYELIRYHNKKDNRLINLIRGYGGTTATEWDINHPVEFVRSGVAPTEDHKIYLEYIATARIEYEPELYNSENVDSLHKNREVTIFDLDINPVKNSRSEGLLYLHHDNTEVSSVLITVLNKTKTPTGSYGPIYIGGDYASIRVTALNNKGNPISNAQLTVALNESLGNINGAQTITRRTGSDGSFVVTYRSPSDPEVLGVYATSTVNISGNTEITFDDNANFLSVSEDEIYLFEVTKDDPHLGTVGYRTTNVGAIDDSPITSVLNGALVVEDIALDVGYFDEGIAYIEYDTGTIISRTIERFTYGWNGLTGFHTSPANTEEMMHNHNMRVLHFSEAIPSGTIVSVRMVEDDAIEWSSNLKNGRKSVVYRLADQTALTHPSMDLDTVYGPLRPSTMTNNKLTYSGELPIPSSTDNDNYLGAYWTASPRNVSLSVYKADSLCGSGTILIDTVDLQISLPQSMLGVYVADTLKVPYGFRILSEDFSAASVLNAATFLTINSVGRFGSEGPYISVPNNNTLVYNSIESTGVSNLSVRITIT